MSHELRDVLERRSASVHDEAGVLFGDLRPAYGKALEPGLVY